MPQIVTKLLQIETEPLCKLRLTPSFSLDLLRHGSRLAAVQSRSMAIKKKWKSGVTAGTDASSCQVFRTKVKAMPRETIAEKKTF